MVQKNGKAAKRGVARSHVKALVFILTIISLSWFFEGLRQIQQSFSLPHIGLLLIGILATVLLVGVQSYWIYLEEKSKGTLKRRIQFFETLYQRSQKQAQASQRRGN